MNSTDVPHLNRWIKASALKAFKDYTGGDPILPEGSDKLASKLESYFEFRCDGPYTTPLPSDGLKVYVEINILGSCKRSVDNFYKKENMQGAANNMLKRDFCVYRTGNVGLNPVDDESYVGVMQLIPSEMIKTSDFGQIDQNVEVYQFTAEAHYEMYL